MSLTLRAGTSRWWSPSSICLFVAERWVEMYDVYVDTSSRRVDTSMIGWHGVPVIVVLILYTIKLMWTYGPYILLTSLCFPASRRLSSYRRVIMDGGWVKFNILLHGTRAIYATIARRWEYIYGMSIPSRPTAKIQHIWQFYSERSATQCAPQTPTWTCCIREWHWAPRQPRNTWTPFVESKRWNHLLLSFATSKYESSETLSGRC